MLVLKKYCSYLVLFYIRLFARIALKIHKPIVIGITGSVGKSSTRNIINAIIKDHFKTLMISEGNSETGIPLGILGITPLNYSFIDWLRMIILAPLGINNIKEIKYLIIEMGIDEPKFPKNMKYLLTIVKPEISIFLNVHPVHTMQFEKLVKKNMSDSQKKDYILKNIAEEKGRIITENDKCDIAIFNNENKYVNEVITSFKKKNIKKIKYFSFGEKENSTVQFNNYEIDLNGTKFSFLLNRKLSKSNLTFIFDKYFLPSVYQECLAAGIIVGEILNISKDKIIKSINKNFYLPKGRSSILKGLKNSIIIDSSYNASKTSTTAFVELLRNLKEKYKKNIYFIFGDMRELGEQAKSEHVEVFKSMFNVVDYLYLVGDLTKKYIYENIDFNSDKNNFKEIKWFNNSKKAGEFLKDNLVSNSLILVKGSQNEIFTEEGIKPLLLNKKEINKLPRQSKYWIEKKKFI